MERSARKQRTVCPVMKLVGDYWALSILSQLGDGTKRFCELERGVTGINPVTLTDRLKKLEKAELIERTEEDKQVVSYNLSRKGSHLLPTLSAFMHALANLH